jgi:hypothetical protein
MKSMQSVCCVFFTVELAVASEKSFSDAFVEKVFGEEKKVKFQSRFTAFLPVFFKL